MTKERKSTNTVRFNSEVGYLFGLIGSGDFDPLEPEKSLPSDKLYDPNKVYGYIKTFLAKVYEPEVFNSWAATAKQQKPTLEKRGGITNNTKYSWAAGNNIAGGPYDVRFHDAATGGIQVKAGSKMLANLKPKSLGLETVRGEDIFVTYGNVEQWVSIKHKVFTDLLDHITVANVWPSDDAKYFIRTTETGYEISNGVKLKDFTREQILSNLKQNKTWQRVFGDWFNANWETYRDLIKPYFSEIAEKFETTIKGHLQNSDLLVDLLQFTDTPYFYTNGDSLYLVPTKEQVGELSLNDLKYGNPDGTGQLFVAKIGKPGAENNALLDVYVRYASGMFKTNPTARLQEFTDPEYISWEKII